MTGAGRAGLGWVLRIGAVVAAAVYAAAALGSGADRMARTDPRLALVVPAPFRANADRTAAEIALATNDYAAMARAGAAAVRSDPLNPSSSALLGWSHFATGQDEPATNAFKVAGQLGWRDPLTQLYWLAAAMQQGDYPVAAQRLDALLRQNPQDKRRDLVLFQLESLPAGRTALVERLAERPNWLETYASDTYPLTPQMTLARYQVLELLGRSGTKLGCEGISRYVRRLIAANMVDEAYAVRSAHCAGSGGSGLLSDGNFENARLDRQLSPFDWAFASDGSLDVSLDASPARAGGSNKSLSAANGGTLTRPFAMQSVRLKPGRYRLTGQIIGENPGDERRFGAAISCRGGIREQLSGLELADGRFGLRFAMPANCQEQLLSLTLAPGQGKVTIDGLALVPD